MFKKFLFATALMLIVSTASRAADMDKIPNPMLKAKVGQWISYKVMGGAEQKQTITAIDGTGDNQVITIKAETMMNGSVVQTMEQKVNMKDAKAMQAEAWKQAGDIKISDAKVTVKGKEVPGVIVEFSQNGMTSKMYMSDTLPVSAIVKMEVSGMPGPMMELVDFGG